MDLDGQIKLGHLLLSDRKCRVCGEVKNLVDGFYRTRKDRGSVASSYSYECKVCAKKRIKKSRKQKKTSIPMIEDVYPDW
jgi:hypothetical protein|tara:strand:- start:3852 stop:4091 length:240 start_codon:yes stop_codon:yes gene_type:complete